VPDFYQYVSRNLVPFADIGSNKRIDYQHIQAAGVGTFSGSTLRLEQALSRTFYCFFTDGFTPDQLPKRARRDVDNPLDDPPVFIPCLRNKEKLQVNAISIDDVGELPTKDR
jgi:hypothetical protein